MPRFTRMEAIMEIREHLQFLMMMIPTFVVLAAATLTLAGF